MIYEIEPEDFNSTCEVGGCFVECEGEILLLHRQDNKPEGGTRGEPAGKVDEGESINEAILREVFEETGLKIISSKYHKKYFVRYPEYDFVFHNFHYPLKIQEPITIDLKEHKNFKWMTPLEALRFHLIMDADERIKLFYEIK